METLMKILNSVNNQKLEDIDFKLNLHLKIEPKTAESDEISILSVLLQSTSKSTIPYDLILKPKNSPKSAFRKTTILTNEELRIPLGVCFWEGDYEIEIKEIPNLDKTMKNTIQNKPMYSQKNVKTKLFPGCNQNIFFSAKKACQPNLNKSEEQSNMFIFPPKICIPKMEIKMDEQKTMMINKSSLIQQITLFKKPVPSSEMSSMFWDLMCNGGFFSQQSKRFLVGLGSTDVKKTMPISIVLHTCRLKDNISISTNSNLLLNNQFSFSVKDMCIKSEVFSYLNVYFNPLRKNVETCFSNILDSESTNIKINLNQLDTTKRTNYHLIFSSLNDRAIFLFWIKMINGIQFLKQQWILGRINLPNLNLKKMSQLIKELKSDKGVKQWKKEVSFMNNLGEYSEIESEIYTKYYQLRKNQRRFTLEESFIQNQREFQRKLLTLTLRNNVLKTKRESRMKLKSKITNLNKQKIKRRRSTVSRQTVQQEVQILLKQKHMMVERLEHLLNRKEEIENLDKQFRTKDCPANFSIIQKNQTNIMNQSEFDLLVRSSNLFKKKEKITDLGEKKIDEKISMSKQINKLKYRLEEIKKKNKCREKKQIKVLKKIEYLGLKLDAKLSNSSYSTDLNLEILKEFFTDSKYKIGNLFLKMRTRTELLQKKIQSK